MKNKVHGVNSFNADRPLCASVSKIGITRNNAGKWPRFEMPISNSLATRKVTVAIDVLLCHQGASHHVLDLGHDEQAK